jgi:hypothetical protein
MTKTEYELLTDIEERDAIITQLRADLLAAARALLPGVYYMDPPDGGNVDLVEQLRRMAKDAARYRWIRQNPTWIGFDSDYQAEFIDNAIDAALGKDDKP